MVRFSRVHKVIAAHRVCRIVQLVRIDGIEIARVRRVFDLRDVGRLLRAQVLAKVDALEERMRLHLVRVLSQPTISATAQLQNQIRRLSGQLRLLWNAQRRLPVDHLEEGRGSWG